jgi:hypothetical protein
MSRDPVAQVSNLLYRRLPAGSPCAMPAARDCFQVCGLEIRDTAQRDEAATKQFEVRREAHQRADALQELVTPFRESSL